MGNFFLIDQSLRSLGGHHFDYSNLVARSAGQAGYRVVVGTNRKFREPETLGDFEVRNRFRYTTYAACSRLTGIRDMVAHRKKGLLARLGSAVRFGSDSLNESCSREQRINSFRDDCESFFSEPLQSGDIVFFTTLSDLEAEGLARFISSREDACLAHWHLQFHFPIFRGRTAAYALQQPMLDAIREPLGHLQDTGADMHFYVTSETLRDQYLQTGFQFESLPYPVHPGLKRPAGVGSGTKLSARVSFAGAVRKEKGAGKIESIMNEIREQHGQSVRFGIQKKRPKLVSRLFSRFSAQQSPDPSLEVYTYPLNAEQYHDFIRDTDIGLLTTYDSETYFSRRAGILGEYLTAGVPVIVPGGSWLSDQVERVQQAYLQGLLQQGSQASVRLQPKKVTHHSTGKTLVRFEPDGSGACSGYSHNLVVLEFRVAQPSAHGNYFHVSCSQSAIIDRRLEKQLIGQDRSGSSRLVPFYVPPGSTCLEFELEPAFGVREWEVKNLGATLLAGEQPIPRSCVGLVAADTSQTAALTGELIRQYGHYRKSAAEYSGEWYSHHDPARTLATLMENSHSCHQQPCHQQPTEKAA